MTEHQVDLVTHTAILGVRTFMPGVPVVDTPSRSGKCLVAATYPPTLSPPLDGASVDVTDCTVFTVAHSGRHVADLDAHSAEEILAEALYAINEVMIWTKSADQARTTTPYYRQVGLLDVKAFVVPVLEGRLILWVNPLFYVQASIPREHLGRLSVGFSNLVVRNEPVHPIVRRFMSSLDLVNLGFYTEAFITLFSLVDDLTQQVMKAGLAKKGLSAVAQKEFLLSIKEQRLHVYLTYIAAVCDWKPLEVENESLYKRLLKCNSLRNSIVHGSERLTRTKVLSAADTLRQTVQWLRTNPFGYQIPAFPEQSPVRPGFMVWEPPAVGDPPPAESTQTDIVSHQDTTSSSAELHEPGPPPTS
jgi:hypothetical protein